MRVGLEKAIGVPGLPDCENHMILWSLVLMQYQSVMMPVARSCCSIAEYDKSE